MDRMMNKLTQRIAGTSSRRGFMRIIGKVTLGGAGAIAALASGIGIASADASCCGQGTTFCPSNTCPSGSFLHNQTTCCVNFNCGTRYTVCNNCYISILGGLTYKCTYTTASSQSCPCEPPPAN